MTNDIEHLFVCFLASHIFLAQYLYKSFILKNWIFDLLLCAKYSLYILDYVFCQICILQIFSPGLWLAFENQVFFCFVLFW